MIYIKLQNKKVDKKVAIILSGGLDSTTLLYDLVNKHGAENITAFSFNYGSRHNKWELPKATKTCQKLKVEHKVLSLKEVFGNFKSSLLDHKDSEAIPEGHYEGKNMKSTVVPFRNGILLAIATGLAESLGIKEIYYGAHGGDHSIYPDCREDFLWAMNEATSRGTYMKVKLRAPYLKMNKISILTKGLKLGVDYNLTHTCYNPDYKGRACGKCGACQERLEAFKLNKVTDPVAYQK